MRNTYRVVLQKDDSDEEETGWRIVAGPELILPYLEYPEIPKSVLFSANNL